jgi:5'(3')-deoxyribonucleotidase
MNPFITDTRKVVGCDLDDVLADFIKSFMAIAGKKYGVDPNIRPDSWEWDGVDMTADRVDGTWAEIIAKPYFWETLQVIEGVDRDLFYELYSKSKVYFPTARAATKGGIDVGLQSSRWIQREFGIEHPTVIVSNEKGPLASALKYDYFIDDRPKNCVEVKKALPDCKVFLQNASHNQKFTSTAFLASGLSMISRRLCWRENDASSRFHQRSVRRHGRIYESAQRQATFERQEGLGRSSVAFIFLCLVGSLESVLLPAFGSVAFLRGRFVSSPHQFSLDRTSGLLSEA